MRLDELKYLWYRLGRSFFRVDLGFGGTTEVAIYNEEGDPVSQSVLDELSYIKANRETVHQQCRKLIFDFVHDAANSDNPEYDIDVAGDWDLLEILEDGESAEQIEDHIGLECIEFGGVYGECVMTYKTSWDHHGMQIRLTNDHLQELI